MVDAVNASQTVLAQIGNEADDPDNLNSVVTVAQLNLITPALTGVIAGNETAYQDYIDGYPDSFSNPATQPEVQAMITQVNFNTTLLANIGTDADNGNNANTGALTAAELNALVGVSGALAANEAAYRAYIAANAAAFSSPATEGEVQAMITQVNANQTLLANIGTDAAAGNNNNTGTLTEAQLNALPNVSGAIAANETYYKYYIAGNVGGFSNPATTTQVQDMIDYYSNLQPDDVVSLTGRIWKDRNLGASRVALSSTDAQAYGDLYQWGRAADGHEIINRFAGDGKTTSGTTSTLSSSDQPPHGLFILNTNDWRNPSNNNLWQGVNGINNPCPTGYRIPTEAEWNTERLAWNSTGGGFTSPLKLTLAGDRILNTGTLNNVNSLGHYWTSTPARIQTFNGTGAGGIANWERGRGFSVRCIKD